MKLGAHGGQPAGYGGKPAPAAGNATTRLITAAIPADKSRVTLHLQPGSGAKGQIALTQNGLLRLIQTLGRIHAAMSEGKDVPPLEAPATEAVFGPRWKVGSGMMGEATTVTFQHPGYGAVTFMVPNAEARAMADALTANIDAAETGRQARKN